MEVSDLQPMPQQVDRANPTDSDYHAMVTNTRLIQEALDACNRAGGGRVVVPPGDYWVRTLTIPSRTDLHLQAGARLVAWPRVNEYEQCEKDPDYSGSLSLLVSHHATTIAISGRGIVDGNGYAFWDPPARQLSGDDVKGASWYEEDSPFWRYKKRRVIPLVELADCEDVLVRDVTITESPGWTLHTLRCDRVKIDGITIRNHLYGPNTDGIDINGCRDVVVSGCSIRCGDDAIIVKATEEARSCERIAVSNCVVATNCAAFGVGAEVEFPIRDISVNGVVVEQALRMVQIELWTAGLVENVVISNMTGATMTDIPLERPVYVDVQHHSRSDGNLGFVRNVQIHGFSAVTRGRCLFTAADGASIQRLLVSGIQLTYPEIEDPQVSVTSSRSQQMSNSSPETRAARSAFVFDNVSDALLRDVQIQWPEAALADSASRMRPSYDRGDLAADKRKQAALANEPPMHGFLFRRCSRIVVDAPFASGNRASLTHNLGENVDVRVNGESP